MSICRLGWCPSYPQMFSLDLIVPGVYYYILSTRSELIQSKNFYHPFSIKGTLALPYTKSSYCYLDWISCQFLAIWAHSHAFDILGDLGGKVILYSRFETSVVWFETNKKGAAATQALGSGWNRGKKFSLSLGAEVFECNLAIPVFIFWRGKEKFSDAFAPRDHM